MGIGKKLKNAAAAAGAAAAVAGSLSAIIPPSLIMIIYGSLASVPIGHLFIGALGPSVLCIGVYVLCLKLFGEVRRDADTPGGTGAGQEAAGDASGEAVGRQSLTAFAFVLALMFVVFGGIYGGVITVGEEADPVAHGQAPLHRVGEGTLPVDHLPERYIQLFFSNIFEYLPKFIRKPTNGCAL